MIGGIQLKSLSKFVLSLVSIGNSPLYRPAAISPLTGVFDVEKNLLPLTPVFTSIKLLMEGLFSTTDSMCLAPSASPIWCFLNSCEHGLILTLSSCTLRIHFFSEARRNP